jgi:hypothetical protein
MTASGDPVSRMKCSGLEPLRRTWTKGLWLANSAEYGLSGVVAPSRQVSCAKQRALATMTSAGKNFPGHALPREG